MCATTSGSQINFFCTFACFNFFEIRVSLSGPSCPETHSVDQAGLKVRDPPAFASQVLALKVCATTGLNRELFIAILMGLIY